MIETRRVYDNPRTEDAQVYLVDRLWPRGVSKQKLNLDGWLREVAPSDELREWFDHDPEKWDAFQRRYFEELNDRPEAWAPLLKAAKRGRVVLLYAARDTEHNNAVALKAFLEEQLDP